MPLEAIVPSKHCLPSREFAERANEYGGEVSGKQASSDFPYSSTVKTMLSKSDCWLLVIKENNGLQKI